MGYLEVYYLIFNIWGFSRYLSVIDFKFNFTVIRQHTLYDLNPFKFIEPGFMAHIRTILVNALCKLQKKNVHAAVVK